MKTKRFLAGFGMVAALMFGPLLVELFLGVAHGQETVGPGSTAWPNIRVVRTAAQFTNTVNNAPPGSWV
jgi:hypothetical protein